jgi:cell division transport system ATP-binding protein
VFLVGHSGTGKSSLLRLLYREQLPTRGEVTVDDVRVDKLKRSRIPHLRRNVGVVFQDFKLLSDKTVWENVAFALQVTGARTKDVMRQVPRVLDLVGLASKARAFPSELSGGEQQRTAIARALVNNPKILLCDEPTGNLDPANTNEVMDLLHRINLKGTTVLIATHNALVVDRMRRRVIRLEDGKIVADEERGYYLANTERLEAPAIGTVTVMIVLLGSFLFTQATIGAIGDDVLKKIEISVFLRDTASPADAKALAAQLSTDRRVRSVVYIPKSLGLQQMRDRLRGQIDTSLLTSNPLPDALRVRLVDPSNVRAVAISIRKNRFVANVEYADDAVQKLLRLSDVLGRIGLGIVALLVLTAAIIISNTIRLTVFARRREIAIMQLVGASSIYIRLPFIFEGFLDGLLGAVLALALLQLARFQLVPKLAAALPFMPLRIASMNQATFALELLVVGATVGIVASWLSVGRYLRA